MRARALLCFALAALGLAPGVAQAGPRDVTVHADRVGDTKGPLDLTRVTFAQQGTEMQLRVATTGDWSARDFSYAEGRSLCIRLLGADGVRARGRVCIAVNEDKPALSYTSLDAKGETTGFVVLPSARVRRSGADGIVASFPPEAVGLPIGRYYWQAHTRWRGTAGCPEPGCSDFFPNGGVVKARVRVLAEPPCFGAAARAPDAAGRCPSRAFLRTVTPTPAVAVLQPNAPCTPFEVTPNLLVCRFQSPPMGASPRQVALIGDSHAAHWRAGLNIVARERGWLGYSMTKSGCPFSTAVPVLERDEQKACLAFRKDTMAWLRRNPKVTTVFLSNNLGSVRVPRGKTAEGVRAAGVRAALRALPKHITRVVVLRDVPITGAGTGDCVERAVRNGALLTGACAYPRDRAVRRDPLADAARARRGDRVRVVDMTNVFCGARFCPPVIGGVLVHKDRAHITELFSTTLGPLLLGRVKLALR